ncbi:hypothetical protein BC833DRAFT_647920 [Globomyces pollinis-pini]|nr:hypothetical protein BC833DRAFT_647920 [Globomyces pollinis-pini]
MNHEDSSFIQDSCTELLIRGYVVSYIKFFNCKSTITNKKDLSELKSLLIVSEDSQRGGNEPIIIEAKTKLANFFLSLKDFTNAIHYFERALSVAKKVHKEPKYELNANCNLGAAIRESGQLLEALEYFEKTRQLAVHHGDKEIEIMVIDNLLKNHLEIAEQMENSNDIQQAIHHYLKCIDLLKTEDVSRDKTIENRILFYLGKAYKKIGDIDRSIKFLESFLKNIEESDVKENEGAAQLILAHCYEIVNKQNIAISYLEMFITKVQADPTQRKAEAQACKQLGILYTKLERYDLSVHYFDQNFKLTQSVISEKPDEEKKSENIKASIQNSESQLQSAMVQLGISKANAKMNLFFETIADPNGLMALIQWKSNRSFGSYVPPAHRVILQDDSKRIKIE